MAHRAVYIMKMLASSVQVNCSKPPPVISSLSFIILTQAITYAGVYKHHYQSYETGSLFNCFVHNILILIPYYFTLNYDEENHH